MLLTILPILAHSRLCHPHPSLSTNPAKKGTHLCLIQLLLCTFLRSWVKDCIYQDHLAGNWVQWRLRQINKLIKKLY